MEIGNLIGFLILIYLYLASGMDIAGLISYLTPYPYNIHLWGCIDLADGAHWHNFYVPVSPAISLMILYLGSSMDLAIGLPIPIVPSNSSQDIV